MMHDVVFVGRMDQTSIIFCRRHRHHLEMYKLTVALVSTVSLLTFSKWSEYIAIVSVCLSVCESLFPHDTSEQIETEFAKVYLIMCTYLHVSHLQM